MRYWKLIIVVILCSLVVIYKKSTYNAIRAMAVVEQTSYQKKTGLLTYIVKFVDNKGYQQTAGITKRYPKNSELSYSFHNGTTIQLLYNEKIPWNVEAYSSPFTWKYLLLAIGAIIVIFLPLIRYLRSEDFRAALSFKGGIGPRYPMHTYSLPKKKSKDE